MAAFIALFDWIELAGVVVTSDALPTQKVTTATCTGAVSTETVYVITNLGWDQVTPAQLAELVRGHWAIENRIHYVRDVTFDEDRSQVRTANNPRVMATLRNVAVGLIRARQRGQNIAAATRTLGRRTEMLLALLDHKPVTPVTGASTLN